MKSGFCGGSSFIGHQLCYYKQHVEQWREQYGPGGTSKQESH